jgi:hypothetical protein
MSIDGESNRGSPRELRFRAEHPNAFDVAEAIPESTKELGSILVECCERICEAFPS